MPEQLSTADARHQQQLDRDRGFAESQFRRLLDKLPVAAYMCDAEGLITYYNNHAVDVWGRAPELNHPVDRFCGSFKLFGTDGSPITHDRCWMALALQQESEFNGYEIVIERPDGARVTALAHANPIRDEAGRLLGAANVLVDITDRKRAEVALREADQSRTSSSPRWRTSCETRGTDPHARSHPAPERHVSKD